MLNCKITVSERILRSYVHKDSSYKSPAHFQKQREIKKNNEKETREKLCHNMTQIKMSDCRDGTADVPYRDITSGQIKDLGNSNIGSTEF